MLKIHRIKKIDNDINILNTIDSDIDILIINKIDSRKFTDKIGINGYDSYIKNIFKNVYLPATLKHLIIEEFKFNDMILDIEETFLTDMFNNLKLPLNCVVDAKYCYDRPPDPFTFFEDKYVRYYSSLNNKEEKFEICKNNIPLMNRNEKFYNEYHKYIKK
jgi:hypothetical protein